MERNGIGHRLRVARGVLSQAEVGKLLGIGKNTLSNYELEKTSPNADFIARFCKALNVSPSWLQTGD
ncbi:MAG: XRE family transcriptional regulator, partial [Deltaproteobacteria bacterium]|nr:XRE family transcriptional regulator [Deltaproteobacteria bacterium]